MVLKAKLGCIQTLQKITEWFEHMSVWVQEIITSSILLAWEHGVAQRIKHKVWLYCTCDHTCNLLILVLALVSSIHPIVHYLGVVYL